jgi:hypothetical protein
MKTADEIKTMLPHFYGTEHYHRFSRLFHNHVLTDGVKWLCENADCYWLVDAIASYHSKCRKDPMLRDFQIWKLKRNGSEAVLTCERDTDDVAIRQKIPYTDFPLEDFKLYCAPSNGFMVISLPSEN